jgi:hypothetical protein
MCEIAARRDRRCRQQQGRSCGHSPAEEHSLDRQGADRLSGDRRCLDLAHARGGRSPDAGRALCPERHARADQAATPQLPLDRQEARRKPARASGPSRSPRSARSGRQPRRRRGQGCGRADRPGRRDRSRRRDGRCRRHRTGGCNRSRWPGWSDWSCRSHGSRRRHWRYRRVGRHRGHGSHRRDRRRRRDGPHRPDRR